MNSLKYKIFKAFAWSFGGRTINLFVSFIISVILARLLEPSDFGIFAIISVLISFSQIFIDLGLGASLIQREKVTSEHYGSVFWFNLIVGVALMVIFYFSAPLIASYYNEPELASLCRVLALLFVINAFSKVVSVRLQKNLNMKLLMKVSFVSSVIGGGVGIAMAFSNYGLWALVTQGLLTSIINNALLLILNPYTFEWKFSWKALKELWSFGFRMFLSGLLNSIYVNIDTLIIGKIFNIHQLGHFNRAKNMTNLLVQNVSQSLIAVLFPVLSSIQSDKKVYMNVLSKTLHLVNFLAFGLCIWLSVMGKDLILIIYGEKWLLAGDFFQWFVIAMATHPTSAVLVNVLTSKGNSKAFLKLDLLKKAIYSLNFIFGFYWGIQGFIIGLIVVYAFSLYFNLIFAKKQLDLNWSFFLKTIFPYLLVALVCMVALYLLSTIFANIWTRFVLSSVFFVLLYFGIAYLFKLKGMLIIKHELNNILLKRRGLQ